MHGGGSTWVVGSWSWFRCYLLGVGKPGPDWDNEYRPGATCIVIVFYLDADLER